MFHFCFWALLLCSLGTQIWTSVLMEPTSAASTRSVWTPRAPTDVPARKGSPETALPAQVGESLEVCSGIVFLEHSICFPYLKKTVVKGGWSHSLFKNLQVNKYVSLTLNTKAWKLLQNIGESLKIMIFIPIHYYEWWSFSLVCLFGYKQRLGLNQTTWIHPLPVPLTSCVASRTLLNLYGCSFPILKWAC